MKGLSIEGVPTINGSPDESLTDIVFGTPETNTTTVEATILRENFKSCHF